MPSWVKLLSKHIDGFMDQSQRDEGIISEKTPIRLGLIVALVGSILILFTSAAGGIWWASGVSTKLDMVLRQNDNSMRSVEAVSTRVTAVELWQRGIDSTGSPAVVKRLDTLTAEFQQLKEDLKLHIATTEKKP